MGAFGMPGPVRVEDGPDMRSYEATNAELAPIGVTFGRPSTLIPPGSVGRLDQVRAGLMP
jgi:hypothetical protein